MTILDSTALRTHIETDLSDAALTRLAAAAEALIVAAVGNLSEQVDYLEGDGREIFTTRAIGSITSIKERDYPEDSQTTLAANDYRQMGKFRLMRLREGTNSRLWWAPEVEVTYAPDVDTSLLEEVQIKLVKLSVVYSGAQRESDGDFDFWHGTPAEETRAALLPLTRSGLSLGMR